MKRWNKPCNRITLSIYILFFLIFSYSIASYCHSKKHSTLQSRNILLNPPQVISSEEFEHLSKTLNMKWTNKLASFQFNTNEKQVSFQIVFDEGIPKEFSKHEKQMFQRKSTFLKNSDDKYSFFYSNSIDFPKEKHKYFSFGKCKQMLDKCKQMLDNGGYAISQPRIVNECEPQCATIEILSNILQNSNVIFYTGAGLSVSSGVPSMSKLEFQIGLRKDLGFIKSMRKILENPDEEIKQIMNFHEACFYSAPSLAHWEIKKIALTKNCLVLTENLDFLHERTGIYPYRVKPSLLIKDVSRDHLKQVEYVICVGLSHDDRGFLNWYKTHNPNGTIISIDYNKPSYLDSEDYWVQEDLQTVFQKLEQLEIRNDSLVDAA